MCYLNESVLKTPSDLNSKQFWKTITKSEPVFFIASGFHYSAEVLVKDHSVTKCCDINSKVLKVAAILFSCLAR